MSEIFKIETTYVKADKKCTTIATWSKLDFISLTNSKKVFHPLPGKSLSWLLDLTAQDVDYSCSPQTCCKKLKICLRHLSGETEIGSGTLSLLDNSISKYVYKTQNLNFENSSGKLCEFEVSFKHDHYLGDHNKAAYNSIQAVGIREHCLKIVCSITFPNYSCNQRKPNAADENIGIKQYWKSLYTSKVMTDVKFAVGDVVLEGHRAVLSNRSEVFSRMFQQDMMERNANDAIEIEDCSSAVFDIFLKYLYVDEIEDSRSKDWKIVLPLLQVADKYNVKCLIDMCSDILIKSISIENALTILQVADLHQVKKLKDSAKKFVNRNFHTIGASAEWVRMINSHPSIVNEFFVFMTSSHR